MNLEILILGDHSLYVWPAFIFSFSICTYFYLTTKKTFQKQEKIFLKEFQQKEFIKAEHPNTKKNTIEVLSGI